MKYEFKKILNNGYFKTLLTITFIVSIVCPLFFMNGYEMGYFDGEKLAIKSGMGALRESVDRAHAARAWITPTELNRSLDFYHAGETEEVRYAKMESQYPNYFRLIQEAYTSIFYRDSFHIGHLEKADDFYQQLDQRLEERVQAAGPDYYSPEEVNFLVHQYQEVDQPFFLDAHGQWIILINSLQMTYYFVLITGIFLAANLFSSEKEWAMDQVLAAISREKYRKLARDKVLALLSILSLVFLLSTLVTASLVLLIAGSQGWETSIQILPSMLTMPYNYRILDLVCRFVLAAFFAILSLSLLTMTLDRVVKNKLVSILLSLLAFVLLPAAVYSFRLIHWAPIHKVFGLSGIQGIGQHILLSNYSSFALPFTGRRIFIGHLNVLFAMLSSLILLGVNLGLPKARSSAGK